MRIPAQKAGATRGSNHAVRAGTLTAPFSRRYELRHIERGFSVQSTKQGSFRPWVCVHLSGYKQEEESQHRGGAMATTKQTQAARKNIKRAQRAANKKRTIANLPKSTRRELGKQAA